ncbi:TcpD family membrane protein [Listeria floridensis]
MFSFSNNKLGNFLAFLIFAGVIFFAIGNPTSIISAIKSVWNMVV